MVPLSAASMLKGREGPDPELRGEGSMRRKGEEEKRRLLSWPSLRERRPTRLCLGLPREWPMGVAVVVGAGTESERAAVAFLFAEVLAAVARGVEWVFVAASVVRTNLEGLVMLAPSRPFVRLEGVRTMLGSTFSPSKSSKMSGEARRRFVGVLKAVQVGLTGELRDWRVEIAVADVRTVILERYIYESCSRVFRNLMH